MSNILTAIDFEFRKSSEFKMELVCVAWMNSDDMKPQSMWLHQDEEALARFKSILLDLRDRSTIVCFNATAEARSFISLGLDPRKFTWVDIQCEWKMLTNHHRKYRHGKQLFDGKPSVTTVKDYWGDKREGMDHRPAEQSLVAATYNLLGIEGDLKYKNEIRQEIIHSESFSPEKQNEILRYCESDIAELFSLKDVIWKAYTETLPTRVFSKGNIANEIRLRGSHAVRSACMEAIGIPINLPKLKRLASQVQNILDECAKEIDELFPDIHPFQWDKTWQRMKMNQKNIKEFIANSKYGDRWERTEKGAISLKLDSFTKHFSYRHDYPKDSLFAQMIRYLKLRQSFNGVKGKKGSETVFDSIGSDHRLRPYFNIYRAQSSRFQPKAKSFPFLWAAWIRSVVEPKPDRLICGIDYGAQEFLISALLSNDEKMIEAYRSGDPYLYLGKAAGVIPQDGTKKSHSKERNMFKWVTLGISYAMTKVGLAKQLSDQMGEEFTEDQAEKLIDLFFKVYSDYAKFSDRIKRHYETHNCIKLADGWYMFGDNPNLRSVGNMPIQGMGAVILRKAIELCQEANLQVIMPLHDAAYVEGPADNWEEWVDTFHDKMVEAFTHFFKQKEASIIRCDVDLWGPSLKPGNSKTKMGRDVTTKGVYIDERAGAEYEKFKKYFEN